MNHLFKLNIRLLATLIAAVATLALASCGPDPIPEPDDKDPENVQVNKWCYQILSYYYLWNDEVKQIKPDYNTDYESFLTFTLGRLKSNTLDGTVYDGTRSFYSYITATPITRAGSFEFAPTYGFSFRPYAFNIQTKTGTVLRYFARIQYVTPNSPAAKSGLKRGDWIGQINGEQIKATNFSDLNKLMAAHSSSVKILKCSFTATATNDGVIFKEDDASKAITLTREVVEENPIHT